MNRKHSRRLHIALVSETWPPEINGVAVTVARFARGLRARGHAVSVVRPRADEHEPEDPRETLTAALGIPFYPGLRVGLVLPARLARRWRQERPDVVYVATQGPLGAAAATAAARLAIPVVAGFHTNFQDYTRHYRLGWLAPAASAWLRGFHRRAWCTLAPTPALAEDLERRGFGRIRVIGRGVDTALFRPARRNAALRRAWGAGPEDLVVLHVGRLAREKNLGLALDAWSEIRRIRPGARFVVVGDGPLLATLRRREPGILFAGARARRGSRGLLRERGPVPVPEPARDLRQRHHRGPCERARRGGLRSCRRRPVHPPPRQRHGRAAQRARGIRRRRRQPGP